MPKENWRGRFEEFLISQGTEPKDRRIVEIEMWIENLLTQVIEDVKDYQNPIPGGVYAREKEQLKQKYLGK